MAAEFKISNFIYNWSGTWTTATFYNRDAMVFNDGKMYVCLVPHTSGIFYADYTATPFPYWNLVLDGKTFAGPWTTGHVYGLGHIAIFGGVTYYCTTAHTSTTFAADAANWAEYVDTANWNLSWQTNHVYGKNDIITYGGIVYKCIANHTSASTIALGLEANQSSWTILYSGIKYLGNWTSGTRYKLNDLVKLSGNIYICNTGHTSTSTFAEANWATWIPGFYFDGSWNNTTTYQPGDTVQYGGYTYVSKTQNNINNIPSTDATDWTLFNQGYNFRQNYTPGSYRVGDVVRSDGWLFVAKADSTNQSPTNYSISKTYSSTGSSGTTIKLDNVSGITAGMMIVGSGLLSRHTVQSVNVGSNTVVINAAPEGTLVDGQALSFTGINYLYWELVVPGTYWTKFWASNTNYIVGDLAIWQNETYVCVANHTASSLITPNLDTNNVLWVPFIPHARKNAMNTLGDMEYYDSTTNTYKALPISITNVTTTEAYVLRDTAGVPTWTQIFVLPQNWYVCGQTGLDIPSYGLTWDQPFKTIAYACSHLQNGLYYSNDVQNLILNKSWMTTEMIQWTLYQMANSLNGFTPSYSLNQTKAVRDANFIIDAIAYDMARGGNSQTVATAKSFFKWFDTSSFYNSDVAADVPYYIPMINYLGTLMADAVSQTAPTQSYQILNDVIPVVSQTFYNGMTQNPVYDSSGNIITGSQAVNTLLGLITTSLSTQSTTKLPPPNSGISASIFVKTGTYPEALPITVPENVAIIGDELRSVTVEPLISIKTTATATNAVTDTITVPYTTGLVDQTPVQFVDPVIPIGFAYTGFGGITPGQNYYVIGSSINPTSFSVTQSTGTYTSVSAQTVISSGTDALFSVTPTSDGSYSVTVTYGGSGYAIEDTLKIIGTTIGAASPDNDVSFTVDNVDQSGAILDFTITSASSVFQLTTATGSMTMYAGDCLKDMFRLRNGTGLRNMTLVGLLGTLTSPDSFNIQRPTGGSYACLDPGTGPNDTSAWIFRRSPYVQNVTAFGNGCTALKIDGNLHNGGFKSMVANDFTHILSDGIGVWCTGPSALTECISVFSYYGYTGYFAEGGGRIRAANGNSSYGTYGVIAEGYDASETPATGTVYNRSQQVQAVVQQSYGNNSQLLRMDYNNAGSGYNTTTTNLLNQSNNFLGNSWVSDGFLNFTKVTLAPTGIAEAWTLTGLTAGPDGSYLYQNVAIPTAGASYTGLNATNVSGSGGTGANTPATFNVTVTSTAYIVTVNNPGSGYAVTNQMYISGAVLGGVANTNDCIITVTGLTGSGIQQVSVTGTVPQGSEFNYTFSVYVKQGSASNIDIQAIYSGSSTLTSAINYNFNTGIITPSNSGGGFLPVHYGSISQQISTTGSTVGWYRLWFTVNDVSGLNTQLQIRIYPRGYNGVAGLNTYFYGSQLEISTSTYTPSFYLEVTNTSKYTAYANYNVTGAGTGVITVGDEIRGNSVFESRITTDSNGVTGGSGYLTASNNAQGGTDQYCILAQSDTNTNGNYTGLRIFVNSGTGAGQYGYISYYNSANKFAYVLKESFDSLQVTSTSNSTGLFTLNGMYNTDTLYVNQPVQFIPTYYTTSVTSTSLSQVAVTQAIGGVDSTFTVASTLGMYINMPLTFTGTTFSTVTPGYTYYIYAIIDSTTIQITNQSYGTLWQLNSATGTMTLNYPSNNSYIQASTTNMVVNYAIQFTGSALGGISVGTVYYINDIIDPNNFTISNALVNVSVTATNSSTNGLTASTTSLIALNPIVFSAPTLGGIADSTKYYIASIIDTNTFTIASSLINVNATDTTALSNLVTVTSTANFQTNQPIRFVGNTIGGIQAETTYYVLAINDSYTFTISQTPGGGAVNLTTATGLMTAITCPAPISVNTDSGTMSGTTTAKKTTLSLGIGSMNATFSTSLFGGVTLGTTYYINTIPSSSTFTVTSVQGSGNPLNLVTKTGSMNLAAVGWDHINVGTPILSLLDTSSVYYIEPRTTYTAPPFTQSAASSTVQLVSGTNWVSISYGQGTWMGIPSSNSTACYSTDGLNWLSAALPSAQSWTSLAYGNGYWVVISSGGISNSIAAVSKANGAGWRSYNLPSSAAWSNVAYGNGIFVAIDGTNKAAYSTNYGITWVAATLPASASWSSLAYGAGRFIAIASGGTNAAYSTDGISWTASTLPSSGTWSSIAYGNNMFVAVCSTSHTSAYTFDGITWYSSNLSIAADKIAYGQGVFVAVSASSTTAYTIEGGLGWKKRTVTNDGYGAICFGYDSNGKGIFATLAGRSTGSAIYAGAKTKGRALVSSGTIYGISEFEPGSNYTGSVPTIGFTDPNVTTLATSVARVGSGVLSSPTFINRGSGYNTSSTQVSITGNGYSDSYQTGLQIILNNLTRLPQPGDNLTIANVAQIYKVTSAYSVYSTVAPYLEANVSVSPSITIANSTANGTAVSIRSKYSQARLTNHDFLNIGYGDFITSNYPGYPEVGYSAISNNQVVEVNYGRVFYSATDQDGNFKVGNLFGVQQATGIVTLSASQFGLTGLNSLSLGGIAVGGSSVTITQFSTDSTFTANSDAIIPTQKAIKTYITSRLSQGGANTFTGQLTAGTVVVGGPNFIRSTVANGVSGSRVKMANKVYINAAGVDGNMAALDFFMRHGSHK